ncbi:hypothetical protein [Streptomyces sp. RFCAC02]|uniref:hypothetical protein n=1 Tax=Streptomyces sp. RFCAC02 TaxID=2499143 RepID=UPI001021DECB|nr:hypothetical protein [Streptomyces sp. RFCAC02]
MPATLSSAFDASVEALRAATRSLPAFPEPGQARTLLFQAQEFFAGLRAYPDVFARDAAKAPGPGSLMSRPLADIRTYFAVADRHVAEALARSSVNSGPAGEPAIHLQVAATHLGASRDLMRTHRGPDGDPVTPYLYLLASGGAQRYVFFRVTDLAWELGSFIERLADISYISGVSGNLRLAHQALHRSVVLGREANKERLVEFGELSVAPALAVGPTPQPDLPSALDRIGEECDRVIRAVFQASRRTGTPLSGSDLRQIGRSLAHGHLLIGRLLLHLAGDQPPELADRLRRTAGGLREVAQGWQLVTDALRSVVDLTDPREHPALPRFSDIHIRTGQVALMPRTQPHPATISVHTASLCVGQLLYGPRWDPTMPPPQPRLSADILNTVRIGPLLRDLHRLPALGQHFAQAAPYLLDEIKHNLVTHSGRRPSPRTRWFALSADRLDHLLDVFHAAADNAKRGAQLMAGAAMAVGADTPRARLDALVRHMVAPGPPPPPLPASRAFAKAQERWMPAHRMPVARRGLVRNQGLTDQHSERLPGAHTPPPRRPTL